ncbi:endolytic transglycosylase MltG [Flavobacterium sp.]|jgi:UPF0755 protein|uniref:endolytic transglycosylase MltG n=1 Tax=Flavobacterium sp. TaxID=239 RepID=UPI0037BFA649
MNKIKKVVSIIAVVIITIAGVYGYKLYRDIFSANTKFTQDQVYVEIPTDSEFENVKKIISPYIEDMDKFETTANKKSYPRNVKSGRFLLKKGMGSNAIINSLRQNVPVNLAFNNQERLEDFAGRIASQLECDSLSILNAFKDKQFLEENGFTEENVLAVCIPNSYEYFWNTTAEKFRDKMAKEYRKFWTEERQAKAKAQNLTPIQVSILASIVHKETVKKDERPTVAGVYLNRLNKGIKLEADPTVIYAVKKNANDFSLVIKRVLNKDLKTVSPYNMYMYNGLPPGPIAMPDITALDAVLNPAKHNYIYFCASVTNFGYHEFAETPAQHEVNRQKYIEWVNNQGIKR